MAVKGYINWSNAIMAVMVLAIAGLGYNQLNKKPAKQDPNVINVNVTVKMPEHQKKTIDVIVNGVKQ